MTSSRKSLKFILILAVTICTSLILVELGSRVLVFVMGPNDRFANVYRDTIEKNIESVSGTARPIAHPFFGFVNANKTYGGAPKVNNMGFLDAETFPYQKTDSEFVVGLFGGSVALSLHPVFNSTAGKLALSNVFPESKGRKIKVLNFALGCFKQPQQFNVSAFFLGSYDVAINVDGYNEAIFVRPSEMPESICWLENLFSQSFGQQDLRYRIGQMANGWRSLTEAIESSHWLSKSAFIFLTWQAVDRLWSSTLQTLAKEKNSAAPAKSFFSSDGSSMEVAISRGAVNWEKYTRIQDQVLKSNRVKAYFFIQPNQHVVGSKPLHPTELALWKDLPDIENRTRWVNLGYRHLGEAGERLRSEGRQIFDLTMAFRDRAEPFYVDDCCHLNSQGQEALFNAIIDKLGEKGK